MTDFGRLLRKYRQQCVDPAHKHGRLTQEQLGKLIGYQLDFAGYSGVAISDWERGKSHIHKDERRVLLCLLRIFYEYGGLRTLHEANELLLSGNYRPLNTEEQAQINKGWAELDKHAAPDTLADAPATWPRSENGLPPGSRMDLRPNPLFVGRETELQAMFTAISSPQTLVLTGIGGIGKTQMAVEFAHLYGGHFPGGVFWFHFDQPDTIPEQVALCGGVDALNLRPDFDTLKLAEQVKLVRRAWQEPIPRLLIFDGCETEPLLTEWWPVSGGCHVLVTSHRGQWNPALGIVTLAVEALPRQESINLLKRFRPDMSDIEASALAAALGDFPLALHLSGSFLNCYRYDISPTVYLQQLHNKQLLQHASLRGAGTQISPTQHVLDVARTFAFSYEHLDVENKTDKLAQLLLAWAACFAPNEPIPRHLLLAVAAALPELGTGGTSLQFADALMRLTALGLVNEVNGDIRLHALLVDFLQQVGDDPGVQTTVAAAVLAVADRLNDQENPARLRLWQSHLRYVTQRALLRRDTVAAGLCKSLGTYLRLEGEYQAAREYLEKALHIFEEWGDFTTLAYADTLNNLGWLLHELGEFSAAVAMHQRALDLRKQLAGNEHPSVVESLNGLGYTLRIMGDVTAAQVHYEAALEICERALPAHILLGECLNNMGCLFRDMGDLRRARPYYERALAVRESLLGLEHPGSLGSRGVDSKCGVRQ